MEFIIKFIADQVLSKRKFIEFNDVSKHNDTQLKLIKLSIGYNKLNLNDKKIVRDYLIKILLLSNDFYCGDIIDRQLISTLNVYVVEQLIISDFNSLCSLDLTKINAESVKFKIFHLLPIIEESSDEVARKKFRCYLVCLISAIKNLIRGKPDRLSNIIEDALNLADLSSDI